MTPAQRLAPMLRWADEIRHHGQSLSHVLLYVHADVDTAEDAEWCANINMQNHRYAYAWAYAIAYVLLTEEPHQ